jgi:RHS repeat-associated protein
LNSITSIGYSHGAGFTVVYRYSFNGQEKDDEINGNRNTLDFGARIYDSRLGRWLALDQLFPMYCGVSGYNFVHNNPIRNIDIQGLFVLPANMSEKEKEFALKIINSAAVLLKDPYVLREFMLHSGLTKSQIEMIFTNGYGPMVEFSCPSDVDHIAEMQVNGSTNFDEMAKDENYSIQDYVKNDKVIFNRDMFINKGNKLDLTALSNPNIPPHHSFYLGVIFLHELVHFGDVRSDGVQYRQYNYSMLYELTNNGENIGEQMIRNMQDITKNAGYKHEDIQKFPSGIEIGKGFEYMTFGWSVDIKYSKERFKEYTKDKKNREQNGKLPSNKEHRTLKSPRSM